MKMENLIVLGLIGAFLWMASTQQPQAATNTGDGSGGQGGGTGTGTGQGGGQGGGTRGQ